MASTGAPHHASSEDVVRYEVSDHIATITLNRPEARNALNGAVRRALWGRCAEAEADPGVHVLIVTGADPAFCAGLDLKELAARPEETARAPGDGEPRLFRFMPETTKPVIAAVNGFCVTGGLEVALQCSFIVASERARFADTHARVGVMPGGGMTVLLPQAIGLRRAREMSLTGNYMGAEEAFRLGLVNHVVAHEELIPYCRSLAADIAGIPDQSGVRRILATYDEAATTTVAEGIRIEATVSRTWQLDGAGIESRRRDVLARGRGQAGS